MHKENGKEKRVGKLGLQLAAFGIALSVFGTATVFGADTLDKTAVYTIDDPYAGITQEGELGIAQLSSLDEDFFESSEESVFESGIESSEGSDEESRTESSKTSSKEESSVKESSTVSSKPSSSNVTSSKPSSSNATSSKPSSNETSSKPASSKPSSSSTSSKPSSNTTSSKPSSNTTSSKPSSSTVSSKPSSNTTSSKPSSSAASSKPASSSAVSAESSKETNSEEELIYTIAGAVQREIVGTGSTPQARYYEAYKAQAIACRSYMEYQKQQTGKYPTMSFATPHAKTIELVREVYNKVVVYKGSIINAVYHADAGGKTQSSQYVWGGSIAYLKAADSPYDVVTGSYTISTEDCKKKLESIGLTVTGEPNTWFDLESASYTDGDFVYEISVCGQKVRARTLREQAFNFGLQSTKIQAITISNGKFTFVTKGYGHGVGLSQRGALGASAAGWSYTKILKNYYTGVSITTI